MGQRPKIVLVGGDGGRSGVPRHIGHLCGVLADMADLTVISDVDRGGYGFAQQHRHLVVPGLATSLNPAAAMAAKRGLATALQNVQPDLVWAHARMSLPLCRWVMRGGGLGRLMVTYHGLPFGPGHGVVKSTVSMAIDSVSQRYAGPHDVVFLTYEDQAAMVGRVAGLRSHVLPNCSWLGGMPTVVPQVGLKRLVMLTRDSAQKNLDLAARVFAALPADFSLDLFGMGTDAPGLRARMAGLMGPSAVARIRFGGDIADVRAVLAGADGLLVTSRYEGLSISMIEAMEMGLPIFSTRVGGTALLRGIHPLFGDVTEDLEATARQIVALTQTYRTAPQDWANRIHALWATHFAPDVWAGQVRALVAGVLDSRP